VLDAVNLYHRRHFDQKVGVRLISPIDPHVGARVVELD
jgi:hypothetical protein